MPASFHWGNRGGHQRADHYGPGGRGFEDRGGSQRHRSDLLAGLHVERLGADRHDRVHRRPDVHRHGEELG